MAVAVSEMVLRVRRLLLDNPHIDKNTTDPGTAVAGDTDSFDVADTTEYAEGNILEFQDNGEQVLVKALTDADTLSVYRGHNDTIATAAHAIGTRIAKDPVWKYAEITEAIRATLETLYPYVYRQIDAELTPSSTQPWYSVAATILDLSQVVQLVGTPVRPFFYGAKGLTYPVQLRRNLPVALSATGVAVHIPYVRDGSNTIFVTGIGIIDDTQAASNYSYIEDGNMADMVVFGTVSRMLAGHDISRTADDDTSMHDQSVDPGDRVRLGRFYHDEFVRLRNNYQMQLQQTLPRMPKSHGVHTNVLDLSTGRI